MVKVVKKKIYGKESRSKNYYYIMKSNVILFLSVSYVTVLI